MSQQDVGEDTEDITRKLAVESANYLGITVEELDEMPLSEIRRRIGEKKKQEYIDSHILGGLQFKLRKKLVGSDTNKLMFIYG